MNWFQENRFLGTFAIAASVAALGALLFLWHAKGQRNEADARFANASAELNRLERMAPFPSAENLRKMKAQAEDYSVALAKLKDELKSRVAPVAEIKPNEFQSRLRVAMNGVAEKARANKVKLPDKFYLGFDEYTTALPTSDDAAKVLGQELIQIEWLMNGLLDARVEAITAFRRSPLAEERGSTPLPTATPATGAKPAGPGTAPKLFERNVVEFTFFSTPAAARKIINQIASANQQFCIIRQLHVRNEKDKGPPRETTAEAPGPSIPSSSPAAKATPAAALHFIVGNEKIETTAKVEIVRFSF